MQARVGWVLIIFGTQVIKKKRSVWPVFPDYLSVSYDYGCKYTHQMHIKYKMRLASALQLDIDAEEYLTL